MKIIVKLAAFAVFFFSTITFAAPVNINTADASEIANALTGVGMSKAQAIVDYRNSNGRFSSADQIMQVKGIGDSTYENNKTDILVD